MKDDNRKNKENGQNIRKHVIPIRFTSGEITMLKKMARQEHDYISAFLRRMLLKLADRNNKDNSENIDSKDKESREYRSSSNNQQENEEDDK